MMFDYKILQTCQFGVPNEFSDVSDCGEPAPYEVWWDDSKLDFMFVCEEHFQFIKRAWENEQDDADCTETPIKS